MKKAIYTNYTHSIVFLDVDLYIKDGGIYERVNGRINDRKKDSFTTMHMKITQHLTEVNTQRRYLIKTGRIIIVVNFSITFVIVKSKHSKILLAMRYLQRLHAEQTRYDN